MKRRTLGRHDYTLVDFSAYDRTARCLEGLEPEITAANQCRIDSSLKGVAPKVAIDFLLDNLDDKGVFVVGKREIVPMSVTYQIQQRKSLRSCAPSYLATERLQNLPVQKYTELGRPEEFTVVMDVELPEK